MAELTYPFELLTNTKGRGPSKTGITKLVKGKLTPDKQTIKELDAYNKLVGTPEYEAAQVFTPLTDQDRDLLTNVGTMYFPQEAKAIREAYKLSDREGRKAVDILFSEGRPPEASAVLAVLEK